MRHGVDLDKSIAALVETWKAHDALYLAAKELRARKRARSLRTKLRAGCRAAVVFVALYVKQFRRFLT